MHLFNKLSSKIQFTSLLLALSIGSATSLPGHTENEEIRLLREQLAVIQARLEALESAEKKAEPAPAKLSEAPSVQIGSSGFSVASADRNYRFRIRGNIHADARFYLSDSPSSDTFLLRRVRPIIDGTVAEKFEYRIMPDLAGSSFTLLDANATYRHSPGFNIQVGKAKSPFDLERLVSQTGLLFIERAYPTILGPNRDIGVQVFGTVLDQKLTYQIAVGNGVQDNASSVSDSNNDKDVFLRLFSHPFRGSGGALEGLGIGFAVSHGERNGVPAGYRTLAQQTFFSWNSNVISDGNNTRLSPQLTYYRGPFGLLASYVSSKHEVALGAERHKLTHHAWLLAASWVLTGENAGYNGVTPRQNFSLSDGTWGAWELAARYSQLDIDNDTFPLFSNPATSATKVSSYTLGVNWFLNRNVKLILNYDHSNFSGGSSGAVTGRNENALLTRAQLSF